MMPATGIGRRALPPISVAGAIALWVLADAIGSTPLRWVAGLLTAGTVGVALVVVSGWLPWRLGRGLVAGLCLLPGVVLVAAVYLAMLGQRSPLGTVGWDRPVQGVVGGLVALGATAVGAWILVAVRGRRLQLPHASGLAVLMVIVAAVGGMLLIQSSSVDMLPLIENPRPQ